MAGKGGDYEGWVLRLIDKAEDILFSYSQVGWLKFAADQIEKATGQGITKGQIGSLEDYRHLIFELPDELGFSIRSKTRYRGIGGRWTTLTKEPTAEPIQAVVYRGEGEKFMGRSSADTLVQSEIEARGVRKKPKS